MNRVDETALEALARAYDREDASQRGEPNPWDDGAEDPIWRAERLACAKAAMQAISTPIAAGGGEATVDIEDAAKRAADMVGVTPTSDMRLFVEQAVKYALTECRAALSTAGAAEPVAHIVEMLDGSHRSVMLVERYDPRKPEFWVNEEVRSGHRIIPLFASPPSDTEEKRS